MLEAQGAVSGGAATSLLKLNLGSLFSQSLNSGLRHLAAALPTAKRGYSKAIADYAII